MLYEKEVNNDYDIVVDVVGMSNIRNFITDYYKEKRYIVLIDDDITSIKIGDLSGKLVTKL